MGKTLTKEIRGVAFNGRTVARPGLAVVVWLLAAPAAATPFFQGLGDLSGGGFGSLGLGLSADGAVVVGQGHSASGNEAFVWDVLGGMRSLENLLVADFGFDLTGWRFAQARGVSADGQVFAGWGVNPSGQNEAWIASIPGPGMPGTADRPEPGTLVVFGLGLIGLGVTAVRRPITG